MASRSIPLLLLMHAVLSAGIVTQEYTFATPVLTGGAVVMDGCRPASIPFAPDIPVRPVRLLLPDGERPVSWEVTAEDPVELSSRIALRHFFPMFRTKPDSAAVKRRAKRVVKNGWFPARVKGESFTIQYKAGHPVFMARINPIQYNPLTGTIRCFRKMTVAVTTETDSERPASSSMRKMTQLVSNDLAALVDNPSILTKLITSPVEEDDYEYLVVTTGALADRFERFVEFNVRRGLRTRIASIETIRAIMAGRDDQEKIRAFIRREWAAHNIVYVLLAGDDNAGGVATPQRIPCRRLYAKDYDYGRIDSPYDTYEDTIPADMYYGCLDGSWRIEGSERYGEIGSEDLIFEVFVGRFPIDDTVQLENIIMKTIRYSETPAATGITNALFVGEYLWGPPLYGGPCYGGDELEELVGNSQANGYSSTGFPSSWTITRLYERQRKWLPGNFVEAMQTARPAFIVHEGHANGNHLFKMSSDGPAPGFTAVNFNQDGSAERGNYFVALSGGCYPGAFDNYMGGDRGPTTVNTLDCVGELLTTHLPTGAVACLFNSRFGFGGDGSETYGMAATDGSDQRLRRYFFEALFGRGIHQIERANVFAKEQNAEMILDSAITSKESYYGQMRWECYGKNLLGDPALSLWTSAPKTLSLPLPAALTEKKLTLRVPRHSRVALADAASGTIFTSVMSGSGDTVTIANDPLSRFLEKKPRGRIRVIVKAHNHYPFTAELPCDVGVGGTGQPIGNDSFVRLVRRGDQYGLRYSLPAACRVTVSLVDGRGAAVRRWSYGMTAGVHRTWFDSRDLAAGVYCWEISDGERKAGGRFAVVR